MRFQYALIAAYSVLSACSGTHQNTLDQETNASQHQDVSASEAGDVVAPEPHNESADANDKDTAVAVACDAIPLRYQNGDRYRQESVCERVARRIAGCQHQPSYRTLEEQIANTCKDNAEVDRITLIVEKQCVSATLTQQRINEMAECVDPEYLPSISRYRVKECHEMMPCLATLLLVTDVRPTGNQ